RRFETSAARIPSTVVVSQDCFHRYPLARLLVLALARVPGTWRGQRRAETGAPGDFPWQLGRECAGIPRGLLPQLLCPTDPSAPDPSAPARADSTAGVRHQARQ